MYEDHPLVRLAITRVGGLTDALDDLPRFLETLGDLIEAVGDYTNRLGLTVGALVDIIAGVRQAEAEFNGGSGQHAGSLAPETKKAVVELWLRGLDAPVVALLFCLDTERVEAHLASRRGAPYERTVIGLHREGHTPTEVSRQLGISRWQVELIVKRINEAPNSTRECGLSELRQRIIRLRAGGLSYGEIKDQTGARTNQIRNAIRWGQAKGLLAKDCPRQAVSA